MDNAADCEGPRMRCGAYYSLACTAMFPIFLCRGVRVGSDQCWAQRHWAQEMPRVMTQDEIDEGNGGVCVCGHVGSDHVGTRGRCENSGCRCVRFQRAEPARRSVR